MTRFILILAFILTTASPSGAQSIDELRKQSEALEKEIAASNELLNKTKNEQAANDRQLRLVTNNINNRKKIVSNLGSEINIISRSVNLKSDSVDKATKELEALKKEYAEMIYSSYKNYKLNNYMAFLFASKDFNDATRRIYYMKRYTLMRERKAETIDSLRGKLSVDLEDLNTKKSELDNTVAARSSEIAKLATEEKNYQTVRTNLTSQSRKYTNDIAAKRKALNNLQAQIKKMIEEEARKAQAQGQTRTAAEQEAFVKLSGQFDENKGLLPFPVSGGVVIDKFGTHPHPTERGTTINNVGITIAADKGSNIRAVFEGEVSSVAQAGMNITVIIRHGSYMTLYSNLESVNVKAGDKVSINQTIGRIYSGANSDNYILHFCIAKDKQLLNPELWLRK